MTTVTQNSLRDANTGGLLVIAATVAALCLGLAGCEPGPGRAAPVDAPRAREALRVTLGRWKDGGRPSESAAASPAVTVQDMDWEAGKALVDFESSATARATTPTSSSPPGSRSASRGAAR